jgi:methyl-accepting chemotaxis protein
LNQEQQQLLYSQLTNTLIKLERDIERHRGSRQYHMRRTNILVKMGVAFLLVMGAFNVFYVWDFYKHMQVIVHTITDLGTDVTVVSDNMVHLTETMVKFDSHMSQMPNISSSVFSMSEQMPSINASMGNMLTNFSEINREMSVMSGDAVVVNQRFGNITQGINVMGANVNAIARPMGSLNNFIP